MRFPWLEGDGRRECDSRMPRRTGAEGNRKFKWEATVKRSIIFVAILSTVLALNACGSTGKSGSSSPTSGKAGAANDDGAPDLTGGSDAEGQNTGVAGDSSESPAGLPGGAAADQLGAPTGTPIRQSRRGTSRRRHDPA